MNPGGLPILMAQGAGAGVGVNAGALAALFAWVAMRNPQNPVDALLSKDAHWLVLTAVFGGVVFGGLVGAGLWGVWRAVGPARWVWATPMGFPVGAATGLLQGGLHASMLGTGSADQLAFAMIGALGGGAAVGMLWPLGLLLRAADRGTWAVVVLAPMVAAAVSALAIGVIVWVNG